MTSEGNKKKLVGANGDELAEQFAQSVHRFVDEQVIHNDDIFVLRRQFERGQMLRAQRDELEIEQQHTLFDGGAFDGAHFLREHEFALLAFHHGGRRRIPSMLVRVGFGEFSERTFVIDIHEDDGEHTLSHLQHEHGQHVVVVVEREQVVSRQVVVFEHRLREMRLTPVDVREAEQVEHDREHAALLVDVALFRVDCNQRLEDIDGHDAIDGDVQIDVVFASPVGVEPVTKTHHHKHRQHASKQDVAATDKAADEIHAALLVHIDAICEGEQEAAHRESQQAAERAHQVLLLLDVADLVLDSALPRKPDAARNDVVEREHGGQDEPDALLHAFAGFSVRGRRGVK
eukprot:CAMPEP_0197028134 /NCGR_PEP_ID=MMETSP1384-20130603/7899_1 /TAXON_ID=29189 /ORGANISM="Ammonia sp." /LENGTH=344 /DNA_ID=CAMNT_0042457087 /DNA_START=941 /DNA_END=1975 /DNA_ORIENTATION=+